MKLIFLAAAFCAVFFTALLFQKKPGTLQDKILISWLIYLGAYIGIYAVYSHELFVHFHLLSVSLISLMMLQGPFLYYYISVLVSDKRPVSIKDLLHLIPFLAFNLYILAASFSSGLTGKLNMEKIGPGYDSPFLFILFLMLTALSGPVYFLATLKKFKKLDTTISNNFSNSAGIDLYWIRRLILVFGIVWTVLISITVIHHVFHMFPIVYCTDGLFASLSLFVILIGYFGHKQKLIYTIENSVDGNNYNIPGRYSGSRLSDENAKQLAQQLKKHMELSGTYLNPDLTLAQLAAEIGISSHVLSQVINEQYSLNFYDFVNQYRVEEFKKRILNSENDNFSFLGIAFNCGFNSKSAFNRIFKNRTGLTPSQFKRTSR